MVIYRTSTLYSPFTNFDVLFFTSVSNKSGVPVGYKLRGFFSKTSKFFSKVYFYIFEELFVFDHGLFIEKQLLHKQRDKFLRYTP